MRLRHEGAAGCTVEIVDCSYGAIYPSRVVGAGEAANVMLPLAKSHGWYDVAVRVRGIGGFERRFAGRVETGKDGISDPPMA